MDETSRPHEFNIHDGKGVQFTSNGSQSQTNNFYTAHRSLFEAHWLPGAEELVVGVPLVRTLRILNHDDEPHTVSLSWGGSPYRRIARSVTSTTVPAGQEVDVDVTFTAEAASPPGGATVEIHMLVLRGKRFETEAKIELTVTRLFAVALAIVEEEIKGDHVAAAVVVRNAGNIDLQAVNVFGLDEQGKAVKPWSKQPFPLGIGQDRRIPVKIRRQP